MQNNYIIRLKHEGLPCWHIIRASQLKAPLLEKMQNGTEIDVSAIGEILASGWGTEIPADIKAQHGIDAI